MHDGEHEAERERQVSREVLMRHQLQLLSHSHREYLDEVVPVRRENVFREQRAVMARVLVLAQLVLAAGRDEDAHLYLQQGVVLACCLLSTSEQRQETSSLSRAGFLSCSGELDHPPKMVHFVTEHL